jgi:hypothetical protein
MDDKPCFNAISHAWGDPTKIREIIINGQRAYIPEKAEQGLPGGGFGGKTVTVYGLILSAYKSIDREQNTSET